MASMRPAVQPPAGSPFVTQGSLVYNVVDYGATGDGSTDDTAAVQDALDAVPAGGGIVYFPAGIYLIPSGGLTCDAPVTITGAGAGDYEDGGSRLRCTSSTATLLTLSAPGSVVSGVAFENTSATRPTAGAGLLCTDFDWGRVERCLFAGFWNNLQVDSGYFYSVRDTAFLAPRNYGAYLRNIATGQTDFGDMVLEGCNFSKYGDATRGATAVRWESGGGLRIIGCKVNAAAQPGYPSTEYWDYGFQLYMNSDTATSVCVIAGNSIEGVYGGDGVNISGAASTTFAQIAITGNEFLTSSSSVAAIKVDGQGMTSLKSVTISGNVAYGSGAGVVLNTVSQAVVVGNNFAGCAIAAMTLTAVQKIEQSNNLFETNIYDNDANSFSSTTGHGRGPWRYAREVSALTTNAYYGKVAPGQYSASVMTVKVFGNVATVGSVRLQQSRAVTMVTGACDASTTVGTDLALGAAAAELSITWDVATTNYVRPKVTSVNGKSFTGCVEVTFDGAAYSFSYAS